VLCLTARSSGVRETEGRACCSAEHGVRQLLVVTAGAKCPGNSAMFGQVTRHDAFSMECAEDLTARPRRRRTRRPRGLRHTAAS
jgi:hypothetical protein